jgi:hypothetical protein
VTCIEAAKQLNGSTCTLPPAQLQSRLGLTLLPIPQLAVVLHQRLEDLIHVHRAEREPDIDGRQGAEVPAVSRVMAKAA